MKRLTRAALVLAALALPAIAFAQKMVISGGGITVEIDCSAVHQTGGKPLSCEGLCEKIDRAPMVSCHMKDGKLIITRYDTEVAYEGPNTVAHVLLEPETPVVVTTDEAPATIQGSADHAILAHVEDSEGNVVEEMGEVDSFATTLYDGEKLVLSSPWDPAEVDLVLVSEDGAAAPVGNATLQPAGVPTAAVDP